MANITEATPIPLTATNTAPKTYHDMQTLYRTIREMWKMKGAESEFVNLYGSERKWLRRFSRQPYDKRGGTKN